MSPGFMSGFPGGSVMGRNGGLSPTLLSLSPITSESLDTHTQLELPVGKASVGVGGLAWRSRSSLSPLRLAWGSPFSSACFLTVEQLSEFLLTLSEPFCKLCNGVFGPGSLHGCGCCGHGWKRRVQLRVAHPGCILLFRPCFPLLDPGMAVQCPGCGWLFPADTLTHILRGSACHLQRQAIAGQP